MELEKNKDNKLKEQIQSLRSGNRLSILTTLKDLRSGGDVSILPELFKLLLEQEDEQITGEISSMLNDLKDKDAASILSEAIRNPVYSEITAIIVSACWQNGLSYGEHLNTFVEVVINGEYEAAIEAFTVIEEAVGEIDQPERDRLVMKLKSGILKIDPQKKPLLSELIKVISNYG